MLRPLLLLACAVALVITIVTASLAEAGGEPATGVANAGSGDCDGDGDVDAIDAFLTLQLVAGLVDGTLHPCSEAGDVDLNGQVNAIDTTLILQFTARLIDELPVGGPKATNTPEPPTNTPSAPTPTNTPAGPTATNIPVTPTATMTNTPSMTGTLMIRKEILDGLVVVNESAQGWQIHIYFDEDCMGDPFITTTTTFSPLVVGLSPGDYSVEEVMQPGYAAVSDTCINVEDLDAGEVVEVVFQNEEV